MRLIPIFTWNKTIKRFGTSTRKLSAAPWFQGVLLLACVIVAMLLANLPVTRVLYRDFLETAVQIHFSSPDGKIDFLFPRDMTIEKFINDILMVVFFFTVGLEIKREIADGELSSTKKAMLPVIAAFGGVVMPALIFALVNHGTAAASGWGIPTATDIAFAVCIMSVLGDKVPISLKVFLTALAIADDLIAILVVALFYGGTVNLGLLAIALCIVILTLILRRLGEKRMAPYLFLAVLVWILFYYSGIHATMSGVVMAFLIPVKPRYNKSYFFHKRAIYNARIDGWEKHISPTAFPNGPQRRSLHELSKVCNGSMDMSYRVEHALSPWVNFLIMPIFALANAGVEITDLSYFNVFHVDPILGGAGMGIFLGLLLGKPVGITLASWLAIKFKVGEMPAKATWKMLFAVACLGGIGFTMSIFVDTLSFGDQPADIMLHMRDAGKIAVLMGSLCAGILGTVLVSLFHKNRDE
ncbi:MAG: Na+/H+ antiporter NhaA [Bacteroidales bacterium]|nr:Na+/H+ antiporter NhaA [Bacteroidales bacterium]